MKEARPFDAFFTANFPPLARLAYALTGNRADSEDLAQEALSKTFENWETVSGYSAPEAWAKRVLVNSVYSRSRRRQTERTGLLRIVPDEIAPDAAELSASTERFWAAVRLLPERQAQVVALHYGDDLTAVQVAEVLQLDAGTVRAHLHAARKSLAKHLGVADDDSAEREGEV